MKMKNKMKKLIILGVILIEILVLSRFAVSESHINDWSTDKNLIAELKIYEGTQELNKETSGVHAGRYLLKTDTKYRFVCSFHYNNVNDAADANYRMKMIGNYNDPMIWKQSDATVMPTGTMEIDDPIKDVGIGFSSVECHISTSIQKKGFVTRVWNWGMNGDFDWKEIAGRYVSFDIVDKELYDARHTPATSTAPATQTNTNGGSTGVSTSASSNDAQQKIDKIKSDWGL
jgi:hypothetical protein